MNISLLTIIFGSLIIDKSKYKIKSLQMHAQLLKRFGTRLSCVELYKQIVPVTLMKNILTLNHYKFLFA